ncbi:glycosyltransferase family 2 protein [Sagittula sp. SSi028]|uniref:glycosyltransferase family 2 protein n=1 Tax=Sagittula sp. SSi028 TaxID=3400636 RepID=UPI003AF520D8
MTKWGTVTTVKAPLDEIQTFAAWHLEKGAHRIYLYLDAPDDNTYQILKSHPKVRVTRTDADYWSRKKRRPNKHQVRQCVNASDCYQRSPEVDWLCHIDVDEFLIPAQSIENALDKLSNTSLCSRVRPIEALYHPAQSVTKTFKAFHLDRKARQSAAQDCFPTYGEHLSGGFLSHVAGKLFFRTGVEDLQIKIHNIIVDGDQNPGQIELADIELAHFHAGTWEHFIKSYRYRLTKGSYREELSPQVARKNALSHHDLFKMLEQDGGEDTLRSFYDEVCTANDQLCARLERHGLLRCYNMDLDTIRRKHFPD